MKGSQFLRKLKALGRARGVVISFNRKRGKGSHGTLYYGNRRTTLKDPKKEIGKGQLNAMLNDLGLTRDELERGA